MDSWHDSKPKHHWTETPKEFVSKKNLKKEQDKRDIRNLNRYSPDNILVRFLNWLNRFWE
jgi:hypothetical protein